MNNGNGKPIPMPNGKPVMQFTQTEVNLNQLAKDASKGAAQIVLEMKESGELAAGLEVATYQVAMELLLTPIKAGIQVSAEINAQMQAQRAGLRAQGIITT